MTHSDNFKLVVSAIENERSKNPSVNTIELRQTKENRLNRVPLNDIWNILRDLELGPAYRIIKIVKENRPDEKEDPWPQLWNPQKVVEWHFNSGVSFTIEILDTYQEWFENYTQAIESEALASAKDPRATTEEALSLPSGVKWEDITIRFVDGHNVNIKYKNQSIRLDYKTMGFEDLKSRRPNKQWQLLERLAENNGEISWERSAAKSSDISKTSQDFGYEFDEEKSTRQNKGYSIIKIPDKRKKTKQLLSQALKAYFRIDEDPFYPYDQVKAYKIKTKLIV
jgi:hypothetical protein